VPIGQDHAVGPLDAGDRQACAVGVVLAVVGLLTG
jgi:hypothetical protein